MSLPQTFIRNLNSSTTKWSVKVRVIRKYHVKSREELPRDISLEFVVHDAEGQRVHISVGQKLMSTYASTLDENRIYEITNFIVTDNTAAYKTSTLGFKIILFTRTTLRQVFDADFPSHVFDFRPFASLADPQVDSSILIDVIGRVATYFPPQTKNIKGKSTRVLDLTIENIDMQKEGRPILPIIPQSLPSTLSVEQDLKLTKDRYRTLSQLCEMTEAGYFWTFAQVTSVECKGEWCYNACRLCYRKIHATGDGYYCSSCDAENNDANWVYRVQVRAVDGTGDAPLTLWDKEVENIVGVSAANMIAINGIKSMPREIANIVGLEGLFKIKIEGSQNGGFLIPFPVKKMTTDVTLISKFFNVDENIKADISEGELLTPILPPPNATAKRKKIAPSVIVSLKRNLEDDFHKEMITKKIKEALEEDDKTKYEKKLKGIMEYNK